MAGGTLNVQVSSVNRRGLDLSVKLPQEWESFEAEVGERVRKVASRGKVNVEIEFSAAKGREDVAWNDAAVGTTLDRLAELADSRHIPFEPTAELLWQIASAQTYVDREARPGHIRMAFLSTLDEALRGFAAMRAKEGEALFIDFIEPGRPLPRAH